MGIMEHSEGLTRIVEGGGRVWSVAEVDFPTFEDATCRYLIFSCDSVIRKVRAYPPDWRERTDSALYEVSFLI